MRKIYFFLLIGLASCSEYKLSSSSVTEGENGLLLFENRKENISIKFYSDYWFHDINKEQTLNWDSRFMKSFGEKHNKEFLYCAHTKMNPYCSSLGVLYMNAEEEKLVNEIAGTLKKELKAADLKDTTGQIGYANFRKLSYTLTDEELKIYRTFSEFYITRGNDVLRIIFWTSESNTAWMD